MTMPKKPAITRRKFMKITGTTLAIAGLPMAARIAHADPPPPVNANGVTPNEDFYITSYKGTPRIDAAKWSLKIHGLVDKPLRVTYDDIKGLPLVTQMLTLECIGNPPSGGAVGNAEWTGARL